MPICIGMTEGRCQRVGFNGRWYYLRVFLLICENLRYDSWRLGRLGLTDGCSPATIGPSRGAFAKMIDKFGVVLGPYRLTLDAFRKKSVAIE